MKTLYSTKLFFINEEIKIIPHIQKMSEFSTTRSSLKRANQFEMEECWAITQIHIKIYSKDKYVGKFQKVNIITILFCKFTS